MTSRLRTLIDLVHAPGHIALATHSKAMSGFPFASAIAFATDERHRPFMLISRLAEHTQNLIADSRASLSVARALGDGEIARAALTGHVMHFEPSELLVRRYLRFHPEAERFMEFGDFQFFRIDPIRIRIVGGFGKAGWLTGAELQDAAFLSLEDEAALMETHSQLSSEHRQLLGIDAYGVDLRQDGLLRRLPFEPGPVNSEAAGAALVRTLKT